jgi:hypothetical protein
MCRRSCSWSTAQSTRGRASRCDPLTMPIRSRTVCCHTDDPSGTEALRPPRRLRALRCIRRGRIGPGVGHQVEIGRREHPHVYWPFRESAGLWCVPHRCKYPTPYLLAYLFFRRRVFLRVLQSRRSHTGTDRSGLKQWYMRSAERGAALLTPERPESTAATWCLTMAVISADACGRTG